MTGHRSIEALTPLKSLFNRRQSIIVSTPPPPVVVYVVTQASHLMGHVISELFI